MIVCPTGQKPGSYEAGLVGIEIICHLQFASLFIIVCFVFVLNGSCLAVMVVVQHGTSSLLILEQRTFCQGAG